MHQPLSQAAAGEAPGADNAALLAGVYDELRRSAARLLRSRSGLLTLTPTDLVNEVSLRVLKLDRLACVDQRHMFATACRIMRQTMVDEVRRRMATKRQPLVVTIADDSATPLDLIMLDDALTRLSELAPHLVEVVEHRFFLGLSVEEIAGLLGQSDRTVKRRWRADRAWLHAELSTD